MGGLLAQICRGRAIRLLPDLVHGGLAAYDQDVSTGKDRLGTACLFDFRHRRFGGKYPFECYQICTGQVRNRNVGEMRITPASDVRGTNDRRYLFNLWL